jgi:hypothetical protein
MAKKLRKSYAGDWKLGQEVKPRDRALAMDRALIMSELFQEENFEKIVEIINRPKSDRNREKDFMNACPSTISDRQKTWLWNYLKNYDPSLNWASSGW